MRRDGAVPLAEIERHILTLRGQKVMLDGDLAALYGVPTKRLNEQVRRNLGRFPQDLMFQLSAEEASALRSQTATSKPGRCGRRYPPYAFTEHGAIMLANVLNTPRAAEVSVYVVRAFVRLRQLAGRNAAMEEKMAELERRVTGHDEAIRSLVQTIRQLMAPLEKTRRSIGFRVEEGGPIYRRRRRQPVAPKGPDPMRLSLWNTAVDPSGSAWQVALMKGDLRYEYLPGSSMYSLMLDLFQNTRPDRLLVMLPFPHPMLADLYRQHNPGLI
jgi:hypothetical protein